MNEQAAAVQLAPEFRKHLATILSTRDVAVLLGELGRLAQISSTASNDLNVAIISSLKILQEKVQAKSISDVDIESLGTTGQAELALIREAAIGSLVVSLSCALLVPGKAADLLAACSGLLGVVFGTDLFPKKSPWDPEELARLLGVK